MDRPRPSLVSRAESSRIGAIAVNTHASEWQFDEHSRFVRALDTAHTVDELDPWARAIYDEAAVVYHRRQAEQAQRQPESGSSQRRRSWTYEEACAKLGMRPFPTGEASKARLVETV